MAKSKKKRARGSGYRASWKGQLTFGMVSFSVEAFNALDRKESDIHFHQVHATCHKRIRYAKVCPEHGEISKEEIVSAYEVKKGKYVEMDASDLESLRTQNERTLNIDAFVSPETIDPLYFDGRMYYLAPVGPGAQEPYAVLAEAMEREDRNGVGQVAFSGKNQLVLIRPLEGVLHMAMLNYAAEIRPPLSVLPAIRKQPKLARQVRMAQSLIEEWSDDKFDFTKYEDMHREKTKELIEAKVRGREIERPEEEIEEPEALSLMDALKRSISVQRAKTTPSHRRLRR